MAAILLVDGAAGSSCPSQSVGRIYRFPQHRQLSSASSHLRPLIWRQLFTHASFRCDAEEGFDDRDVFHAKVAFLRFLNGTRCARLRRSAIQAVSGIGTPFRSSTIASEIRRHLDTHFCFFLDRLLVENVP